MGLWTAVAVCSTAWPFKIVIRRLRDCDFKVFNAFRWTVIVIGPTMHNASHKLNG